MKNPKKIMFRLQLMALLAIGAVPYVYAQQHPGCVSALSCYYGYRTQPGGYCGGTSPYGTGITENDDNNTWWLGDGACGTNHDIFGNDLGTPCGPTPVTMCS